MRKRKEGHSSNQIMTSFFTFVALAKASAAQLQCKGILEKEIKTKLSLHAFQKKVLILGRT